MIPRWERLLKEYLEAVVIALILAVIIRTFFVQAFKIPSGSMLETLQIGDHLLVSKIIYGIKIPFLDKYIVTFAEPKQGDIIVFEYPEDTSKDFIKRIVGVPGDTIEIRNKEVWRNGEKIVEPYAQHTDLMTLEKSPRDNKGPLVVPENKYFVMGDNRDESHDSRFWGFVDKANIRGKAWMLYWSWRGFKEIRWNRIGTIVH